MKHSPKITMRFGAAHDDIIVDGIKFNRTELVKSKKLTFVTDEIVKVMFPGLLWWRRAA